MKLKTIHQLMQASLITAVASTAAYAEPKIEFGGVVEASITSSDDNDSSTKDTQAKVDTVELAITATMNDKVSAEVVLLSEDIGTDDETAFAVDSALINMETAVGTVSAGKFTVPFTTGETNMIEDSATLVEPVGVGIALSGAIDALEYTLYAADPMKDDAADINDKAYANESALGFGDLAGVNVNIAFNDNLAFNGSYVSLDGKTGTSGALIGSMGDFGLILEATNTDIADETRSNIELSYDVGMGTLAAAMQKNADGDSINSVGFSSEIYESTALNLVYSVTDPKAAGDNTTAVAAQLAYEF